MEDLRALHHKTCPSKHLGNFWKSIDYQTAAGALTSAGVPSYGQKLTIHSAPGRSSNTWVHPLIALAFFRWARPDLFYSKLIRIIDDLSERSTTEK